jgi:tellurite resistance protein TehA-like permease
MTSAASRTRSLGRVLLEATPPASGGVVMGTGIVSVALLIDKERVLSAILLVLCALLWVALAMLVAAGALIDRARFLAGLGQPGALTAIAGSAVLGTRLTLAGWGWAGNALLIAATALSLGLVPHVLRRGRSPATGASFLLAVAPASLALLAATVSSAERVGWLVDAALAPFVLGLCFYALVLSRFQFRQLAVGAGDHWVTGGALAISTLAAAQITVVVGQRATGLSGAHGALEALALVLWCLTIAWLPALVATEALRPRLSYNVERWASVFPVGMYAACSYGVGTVTHTAGITDFARVWVWVALALWLVVFAGMVRRAPALVRPVG